MEKPLGDPFTFDWAVNEFNERLNCPSEARDCSGINWCYMSTWAGK
jgi:hypothetical protein